MSKSRADITGAALENRPQSIKPKRPAPKPAALRTEHEEIEERQGKPVTYRLRPATREAVIAAADKHNVRVRYMADFLLTAALVGLNSGRLAPEIIQRNDEKARLIKLPDVPEI